MPQMRDHSFIRIAAIAAAMLFVSFPGLACGGSGSNTTTATPAPTQTSSSTAAPAGTAAATHTVPVGDHTLTLPDSLNIERWVTGRDALRMMALTPDGLLLVTEMGRGNVLAYPLAGDQPQPVTVIRGLSTPSGIAFHDGYIYVAEEGRVSRYEYKGAGAVGPQLVIVDGIPTGGHQTRTIGVGPDGKLYLTVGSSCNLCEEKDQRRAAMSRCDLDGSNCEVIASGLRNTVGFTWQPGSGQLWGTDNGRDNIGDDLPPDEVNIIVPGKDYGWPFCYGDGQVNPEYAGDSRRAAFCAGTEFPVVNLQAHSAPLGLCFLTEPAWPAAWQGDLFIAYHGSWNRTIPTGYKVVRVDRDRTVSDLITGWLDEQTGKYWGRPVDILFVNNRMYISDDYSGSIYRVTPAAAAQT